MHSIFFLISLFAYIKLNYTYFVSRALISLIVLAILAAVPVMYIVDGIISSDIYKNGIGTYTRVECLSIICQSLSLCLPKMIGCRDTSISSS